MGRNTTRDVFLHAAVPHQDEPGDHYPFHASLFASIYEVELSPAKVSGHVCTHMHIYEHTWAPDNEGE